MSHTSKYFIAIIPPSPMLEEAWRWKQFFQTEFNSKAALHSPPHITLHMPFEWKEQKEPTLVEQLQLFAKRRTSFELSLQNFGNFEQRVIYIAVGENESLKQLQADLVRFSKTELNLFNANRLDLPFHPHLTVAFRDLNKLVFPKAWEAVRTLNFERTFMVNSIALLKHDGKKWHVNKEFGFKS